MTNPKTTAGNPNWLLDGLIDHLSLKNDAALSRALDVAPPVISKIRNRKLPVGPSILVRMYDVTGLSINELRKMADTPIPARKGN